ncbi:MarR family transcriptional regulator [Paenibacillus sambharensis]|uniref:MarR family transcriptional regulator n=1 Tax=Paenibacillus sambharensis TaxID=1803190 RepID=A0A2W1L8V7_9BACL|nr:MarR family transcriptional regulator [Paenibacillus sambharensis]PZD95676.1 MarR family transcriptional regulator [Paenibacillus sambharensis]
MNDPAKQMIYELYLRLLHLNEQKADTDIRSFLEEAIGERQTLPGNMTSIHVVDCIGRHEPINSSTIARKMNLSKANITKISTRLLEEGFIRRFQLTDNKKEVYFRLTPKGRQVFELHEKVHKQKEEQFYTFLDGYSEAELSVILKFMRDMTIRSENEHTKG